MSAEYKAFRYPSDPSYRDRIRTYNRVRYQRKTVPCSICGLGRLPRPDEDDSKPVICLYCSSKGLTAN